MLPVTLKTMIWNDMITRLAELKNDVTNSVRSISSMSVNAVNISDISADDHTVFAKSIDWHINQAHDIRFNISQPNILINLSHNTAKNLKKMEIRLKTTHNTFLQANIFPTF